MPEKNCSLKKTLAVLTLGDLIWTFPIFMPPELVFTEEQLCEFISLLDKDFAERVGASDKRSEYVHQSFAFAQIGYGIVEDLVCPGPHRYRVRPSMAAAAKHVLERRGTFPGHRQTLKKITERFCDFIESTDRLAMPA